MKRHTVACVAVTILILTGYAPAHCGSWSLPVGGSGLDVANSARQTSDGGSVVAGSTTSSGAGSNDAWVLKLNAAGGVAWQKTYGGAGDDAAYSIQQTTDGGYIVAGHTASSGAGSYDAWVLKLDANGGVVWQRTYGGANSDFANAIQQTTDGGYIVAGFASSSGAGSYDAWALKLNADGSVAWQKTYGGTGEDGAYAVQQTIDGGYIVAGYTASFGAGSYDTWVLKLNTDGSVAWQKTYGGGASDLAYSIRQTADGGYIVAGYTASSGAGSTDAWVLKLNSDGGVAWQKTYGGASSDDARDIQQTADGGYIVAGQTTSSGAGSNDVWMLKLNADGGVAWQKTYGGTSSEYAYSIRQGTDNGYIVAGRTNSFGTGGADAWILRLDTMGSILGCSSVIIKASTVIAAQTYTAPVDSPAVPAVPAMAAALTTITPATSNAVAATNCLYTPSSAQWQKTYGGADGDYAYAVQQTDDGGYVVAGATDSEGLGNGDMWVLKLNADGSVAWQNWYGSSGYDSAESIQQTVDGGFIVSGSSSGAAWVLKLYADGRVNWHKLFGSNSSASAVLQTPDGGYIVAGALRATTGDNDTWVLKLDADGGVVWQKRYGGTSEDFARSIQLTADGGYIIAGETSSSGAGDADAWVLKLNANGSVAWTKTYGTTSYESAGSILQTSDGGYVVAGVSYATGGGAWVLKLHADGSLAWQKTYGGSGNSIQQTADGGYIVAGALGNGVYDAWLFKLHADGSLAWQKTYGGENSDFAKSVRQTSDGGFIVAGFTGSFGAAGFNTWAMKLDQIGGITGCGTIAASTAVAQNFAGVEAVYYAPSASSDAVASTPQRSTGNTGLTSGTVCSASYTKYFLNTEGTGPGAGSITSSPAGIDCGATCSYPFTSNTSVTLTAHPSPGSTFAGWSGGLCSGTSTCTVSMGADSAVAADFIASYTLNVSLAGAGGGTVTSDGGSLSWNNNVGTATYPYNRLVTLTAWPDAGSALGGWSGEGCSGTEKCSVTMNANRSVTATLNVVPRARIGNTPYGILNNAYIAVTGNGTVEAKALTFSENLTLERAIFFTLKGGYADDYLSRTGYTTLDGNLTIGSGGLTVDRLVVK